MTGHIRRIELTLTFGTGPNIPNAEKICHTLTSVKKVTIDTTDATGPQSLQPTESLLPVHTS